MYPGKVYQVSRPKTGELRASITEINFMLTYIANEKKKDYTSVPFIMRPMSAHHICGRILKGARYLEQIEIK